MRIALNVIEKVEKPNGLILYKGPSLINGKPIVVIATNLSKPSDNRKTGDFIQTYIIPNNGLKPTENYQSGGDEAVCGDCIHRKIGGFQTCYVNLAFGPNQVFKAFLAGKYPVFNTQIHSDLFKNRLIRLGAWGDPSSVDYSVWKQICDISGKWTGYTHQWRKCDQNLKTLCMASVETVAQMVKAKSMGWKTFRVRRSDEPIQPGEFLCPASAEAGKRLKCETCLACKGNRYNNSNAVTPVIVSHGLDWKSKRFNRMQKLMVQKKKFRNVSKEVLNGLVS